MSNFKILKTQNNARLGLLKLKHGLIKTPAFMPVATKATVKCMSSLDMDELGAQILMSNTYHLFERADIIEKHGHLHGFMNWNKPIITDSAGFQVFSLGLGLEHFTGKIGSYFIEDKEKPEKTAKKTTIVKEDGVKFQNGFFTPERSIEIQEKLGSDIMIAFDECTSPYSTYEYTKESLERTHRWAKRCIDAKKTDQALFGVIQGGMWEDLRKDAAKYIASLPFDGFCIGGSLGKSKEDMHQILEWVMKELPDNKARHLLGIGAVEDIIESVDRGVDLFDCVGPTRIARAGYAYCKSQGKSKKYRIRIKNSDFKEDQQPLDPTCRCKVCKKYSRSYIRHLFKAKEYLAYFLTSYHNLHFILQLMRDIRESIELNTFDLLKKEWLK